MQKFLVLTLKLMSRQRICQKEKKFFIKYFNIIYEVIDEAQKIIDGITEEEFIEELIGKATIKKVFELSDATKVAGCLIDEGKVTSKAVTKIFREKKLVSEAEVEVLKEKKIRLKKFCLV